MTRREISLLFGGDYDRTRLLQDPEVAERNRLDVDITHFATPHEVFHELTHSDRGDGGELSLSFYTTMMSHPDLRDRFVALPVPVSRFFRHGNILVRRGAGIESAADLRGKTIGIPEYGTTMIVWLRGILADEHGVLPHEIRWRAGRDPVALAGEAVRYPPDVDIARAESTDLVGMLADGRLDAFIGMLPPQLPSGVERLFPDYGAVEREYFTRTGIFPIMHLLVLRREAVERDPGMANALYGACLDAKEKSLRILRNTGVLGVMLPWLLTAVDEQEAAMGGDLWPYGVEELRPTTEKFIEYARDQGLLWNNDVTTDDLYLDLTVTAPSSGAR
ncbi:hypothetical protein [Nocardioides sp. LHG3406-4]|uniref:hypothetical protein n=1 Tax=Nocardioides sp. LHG3406-4 TaxID=2804575 RepID=UPI003CECA131